MSKDPRLIFEAYLREDRYARENPEEFEDIDYAQRAGAEDAMDRHSSLMDVAYDMIDTMGTEMEGHEVLERLIRELRKEEGVLHGHIISWKNMFLKHESPEGLKNYVVNSLLPTVEKWTRPAKPDWNPRDGTGDPREHPNALVRRGLGTTLDVLDGVLMMNERERLAVIDGPQD